MNHWHPVLDTSSWQPTTSVSGGTSAAGRSFTIVSSLHSAKIWSKKGWKVSKPQCFGPFHHQKDGPHSASPATAPTALIMGCPRLSMPLLMHFAKLQPPLVFFCRISS